MSSNGQQQKQAQEPVAQDKPILKGGLALASRTKRGQPLGRPNVGKAMKPYRAAGDKQIAKQIAITKKTEAASTLHTKAFEHTVDELTRTSQISVAKAQVIENEEFADFVDSYVRGGLNFMTESYASFLDIHRGKMEEIIDEDVKPTLWDHI